MKQLKSVFTALFFLCLFSAATAQDCDCVEKKQDKFNGATSWSCFSTDGIIFSRIRLNDQEVTSIMLWASGSTITFGKGVIILLDNGDKIEKPDVAVEADATDAGYRYIARFHLSPDEIGLLSNHLVTDFRLYIYDKSVSKKKAEKMQNALKCIVWAK